jgi:YfiH family protein
VTGPTGELQGTERSEPPPGLLRREAAGVDWYEAAGHGWRAAFSTRHGGVSRSPYDGLNVGFSTADRPADVARNRNVLAAALGIEGGRLVVPGQVHGLRLAEVGSGDVGRGARGPADVVPDTDGLLTRAPDVPLFISFADCVPVLIVAGEPACALALVHAGWRGMLAGIVGKAARAVTGFAPPRAAVIGPSIGPCCFAVSAEVGERFEAAFPGTWRDGRVDLWETARRQLEESGVGAARVVVSGLCTHHDRGFFSHRRDRGLTGRQAAIAWLTAERPEVTGDTSVADRGGQA